MKKINSFILILVSIIIISCNENTENTESTTTIDDEVIETPAIQEKTGPNYGIGPVKKGDVILEKEINLELAKLGQEIYEMKCSSCHKPTKKFIGPAPIGIFDRRTPEWVMNLILNPDEMTQKDPDAKKLLIEFNGAPMANQNISIDDARAILEYFRTIKEN